MLPADGSNARTSRRYSFRSAPFRVRAPGVDSEIRLKDLSRGGACGLMAEPLTVGDYVIVELDARHQAEAEVCWVRRMLVGLRFTQPLTQAFVEGLHARNHGLALSFPPIVDGQR
ncbi:PilZ domain-containing protein [Sphingomonas sp.]|uniref:PilZ domain-containing protein n=1 Tax=Sphingomonas sp. TaxID=28214 RepID=UPI001B20F9F9|nr:PilZ domain-containing protein [Sphingomonas sp.]MBO9713176.1 PilZ domain-containing protein [Sphingomonas sp.]